MKKIISVVLCIGIVFSLAGCQSSPNRAPEGAVIGGIVGAGLGAIIGNQQHDRDQGRTRGALIGGAVGAIGGAVAGSQVQKQPQPAVAPAAAPAASPGSVPVQQVNYNNPNQMSLQQIVELTRQGVHEDVIVDRIRLTNSKFNLSQADLDYLKNNGVSQKVMNVMQGL